MEPTRTPDRNSGRPRPTTSIIAVAVFQIVGSVLTLVLFKRGGRIFYFSDQSSVRANALFVLCSLLGTALLEIVTAIALLRLKNWARQRSLRLPPAPLRVALTIPAHLRKPHPPWDFTALLVELALWVLIP